MLFNEPKLLKWNVVTGYGFGALGFSALQRAEIAEIGVSQRQRPTFETVSVLFNEPKLLKSRSLTSPQPRPRGFSALQRAEIAEMCKEPLPLRGGIRFSALQRAEIAEIIIGSDVLDNFACFSALQRAEIAEIMSCLSVLTFQNPMFQCSSTSRNC